MVVACHLKWPIGNEVMSGAARVAVLSFFVMSGYVLAFSYDGRVAIFCVRRFVRLWPLYGATIAAAYALNGSLPPLGELVCWPALIVRPPPIDPPAWTLYAEVWVTPILPVLFWLTARNRAIGIVLPPLALGLMVVDWRLYVIAFFAAGVGLARFAIPWPRRVPAVAIWLGRVSYSLYLTHWVVLIWLDKWFGPLGPLLSLPVILAVAWAAWRVIEQPSIGLSRRIGRSLPPMVLLGGPESGCPHVAR